MEKILKKVGFNKAAKLLPILKTKSIKMKLAYKEYSFISFADLIKIINEKDNVASESPYSIENKINNVEITSIDCSMDIPPIKILEQIGNIKNNNIFDNFIIVGANGDSTKILFGLIGYCGDCFFITTY